MTVRHQAFKRIRGWRKAEISVLPVKFDRMTFSLLALVNRAS